MTVTAALEHIVFSAGETGRMGSNIHEYLLIIGVDAQLTGEAEVHLNLVLSRILGDNAVADVADGAGEHHQVIEQQRAGKGHFQSNHFIFKGIYRRHGTDLTPVCSITR